MIQTQLLSLTVENAPGYSCTQNSKCMSEVSDLRHSMSSRPTQGVSICQPVSSNVPMTVVISSDKNKVGLK